MGIFKKALHSKIDVFVKFESAINQEIRSQIKKKPWIPSIWVTRTLCMYFHQNLGRSRLVLPFFLGDFKWNDPVAVMVGTVIIIFSAISRRQSSRGPTRGKT